MPADRSRQRLGSERCSGKAGSAPTTEFSAICSQESSASLLPVNNGRGRIWLNCDRKQQPRSLRSHAVAALTLFLVLNVISLFTVPADGPGYEYVPGQFHVFTFLVLVGVGVVRVATPPQRN